MWKISAGGNLIVQQHVKKSLFYIIYIREHYKALPITTIMQAINHFKFSLVLVYIITIKYKEHIQKKESNVCILLKLGIYILHWKTAIKNTSDQN